MSEEKVWAMVIGGVFICAFAVGKGCNDSDNKSIQKALDKGCSATHLEHSGWVFNCPDKCSSFTSPATVGITSTPMGTWSYTK